MEKDLTFHMENLQNFKPKFWLNGKCLKVLQGTTIVVHCVTKVMSSASSRLEMSVKFDD